MKRILASIVATLPEAQKMAIELAFFKGMSQREISIQTKIPLGTIKTRLELGIRKISAKLKEITGESIGLPIAA
jgi:RNA polymerase sigma-70 factor (ECF subfamily)